MAVNILIKRILRRPGGKKVETPIILKYRLGQIRKRPARKFKKADLTDRHLPRVGSAEKARLETLLALPVISDLPQTFFNPFQITAQSSQPQVKKGAGSLLGNETLCVGSKNILEGRSLVRRKEDQFAEGYFFLSEKVRER